MVKLTEIIRFFNQIAPSNLAESYDNVGLLIGNKEANVQKVLVTLDVDEAVVEEAKSLGADLIISHHPLIFKPLSNITTDFGVSRAVMSLIKNDIALCSMHTNFDSVENGLGDLFLDKIGKTVSRRPIEGCEKNGIGRIGQLEKPLSLLQLLNDIKKNFSLSAISYIGNEKKTISNVAICNGSGADFIYSVKEMGADCLITGDIKYQHARFAYENHLVLIEVPHYFAEAIFSDYVIKLMQQEFKDKLELIAADSNQSIWKTL